MQKDQESKKIETYGYFSCPKCNSGYYISNRYDLDTMECPICYWYDEKNIILDGVSNTIEAAENGDRVWTLCKGDKLLSIDSICKNKKEAID